MKLFKLPTGINEFCDTFKLAPHSDLIHSQTLPGLIQGSKENSLRYHLPVVM